MDRYSKKLANCALKLRIGLLLHTRGPDLGAMKKQSNIFNNGIPGDPGHEKLLVNRET